MENQNLPVEKSEILFLYESSYSVPNGDPFTSEQRYDEETKKVLVSDVRIKRFIRDYFIDQNSLEQNSKYEVYVIDSEKLSEGGKESGSAIRINFLANKKDFKDEFGEVAKATKSKRQDEKAAQLLKKCIDVRLFGGISTKEGASVNFTGPIQFALLNPSLNKVDLRMHQNTSVFASSEEKSRGAIGTTTVVPYSLNQIHGWINPFSARHTDLSENDVAEMFKALWVSINNANTRSKSNQNSLLLIQIIYSDANKKIYGTDRLIQIDEEKSPKQDEQIRNFDDYVLNFDKLKDAVKSSAVKQINFYTENDKIKSDLENTEKFVWKEIL